MALRIKKIEIPFLDRRQAIVHTEEGDIFTYHAAATDEVWRTREREPLARWLQEELEDAWLAARGTPREKQPCIPGLEHVRRPSRLGEHSPLTGWAENRDPHFAGQMGFSEHGF